MTAPAESEHPAKSQRKASHDGSAMPLMDHLRELRGRLVKALLAITVGAVVAWFFYQPIIKSIITPFCESTAEFRAERDLGQCSLVVNSVTAPFMLQLQVSIVVGMIVTSPVWLYQLWRFITPGLHRNERRWTLIFLAASVPLFVAGAALAFYVLPKGITILLDFTPDAVVPLIPVDSYLRFVIRTMLVFGLGFLMPVIIVILNLIGILPSSALRRTRNWTVVGIFIFAAVGTPTGDPLTMSLVALPMWGLYEAAVVFTRINDRRRRTRDGEPDYDSLDDDEASPIGGASTIPAPDDVGPSGEIDEDDETDKDEER
ncbi:MAG TPA: twin-arginine translocase subunit TatC [Actinomycetes bacterium]|nr:twin-arginine translocase subunit TatC [Actinomycetes bacterium]